MALTPELRGLIHALTRVLVRELEAEEKENAAVPTREGSGVEEHDGDHTPDQQRLLQ